MDYLVGQAVGGPAAVEPQEVAGRGFGGVERGQAGDRPFESYVDPGRAVPAGQDPEEEVEAVGGRSSPRRPGRPGRAGPGGRSGRRAGRRPSPRYGSGRSPGCEPGRAGRPGRKPSTPPNRSRSRRPARWSPTDRSGSRGIVAGGRSPISVRVIAPTCTEADAARFTRINTGASSPGQTGHEKVTGGAPSRIGAAATQASSMTRFRAEVPDPLPFPPAAIRATPSAAGCPPVTVKVRRCGRSGCGTRRPTADQARPELSRGREQREFAPGPPDPAPEPVAQRGCHQRRLGREPGPAPHRIGRGPPRGRRPVPGRPGQVDRVDLDPRTVRLGQRHRRRGPRIDHGQRQAPGRRRGLGGIPPPPDPPPEPGPRRVTQRLPVSPDFEQVGAFQPGHRQVQVVEGGGRSCRS